MRKIVKKNRRRTEETGANRGFGKEKREAAGAGKRPERGGFSRAKRERDEFEPKRRSEGFRGEFRREEAPQEDYIFGINPVKEALRGERAINSILIASGGHNKQIHEIIELAKERRVPVKEVPSSKLNAVSENRSHQNVIAYVSPVEYYSLEKALMDNKHSDFIVALDGVTDVHNLGAIMRTVEASGFKYVMIPERRSAQLNSTVAKTSAGAIEFVRTIRVSSLGNAIRELKEKGYWVVGADVSGKTDFSKVDYSGKILLIIGAEDRGISPNILKQCDYNVKIPMHGRINSLNASVSASILIYEALKHRSK